MSVSAQFKGQLVQHLLDPKIQFKKEISRGLGDIVHSVKNNALIGPIRVQIQQLGESIAQWKLTGPSDQEIRLIEQNYQFASNLVDAHTPGVNKAAAVGLTTLISVALLAVVASIKLGWS